VSRFLFVTWDGGGNVNPVVALSSRLHARAHEVTVLGSASLGARVQTPFVPRDPSTEWDARVLAEDVLAQPRPDVFVVDYMLPSALSASESTGRPTAALVHTLYGALLVDGELDTMSMAASVEGVNAIRVELGLAPIVRMTDLLRPHRVLVLAPAALDDPVQADAVYVGPVLEHAPPGPPALDAPLVVVSLGTTDMGEGPLLQRVLDALADAPLQVQATVGAHLDPTSFEVPDNASVTGYVPHAAVLPHAAALVTHAGLGSVLAALSFGVPMVCLPLGREQPANAAAVERLGAGRVLPPDAGAGSIRAAVAGVLRSGSPVPPVDGSGQRAVAELEALAGQ
jgi:hypothetical protein